MGNKLNELNDFSNAKIGDPVTSIRYGKGVIIIITNDEYYPIHLKFDDDTLFAFSKDGYYLEDEITPDLYKGHGHFNILFVPDVIEEIPIIDKSNYRPYSKFVDLTGKKVIGSMGIYTILASFYDNTYIVSGLKEYTCNTEELFDIFTFEDGSYCGELKEDDI